MPIITSKIIRRMIEYILIFLVIITCLVIFRSYIENSILFHPTHEDSEKLAKASNFEKWFIKNKYTGWKKLVGKNNTIWLFLHGNAGQAIDRLYAENCFNRNNNIFILEYPGYGERKGIPSMKTFNNAAVEAYNYLKKDFPKNKICVVGESIGTGPACYLANQNIPPDKIVLITPFDKLEDVAKEKLPFLPISKIMKNKWNNIESLESFEGDLEIYGAKEDQIIPVEHALKLSKSNRNAKFHLIPGGHNDWPYYVKLNKLSE